MISPLKKFSFRPQKSVKFFHFSVVFSFVILSFQTSQAISPADHCASKPTVACELLNSTTEFIPWNNSYNSMAIKVHKKYCQNGLFKSAVMIVENANTQGYVTAQAKAEGIQCMIQNLSGHFVGSGQPASICSVSTEQPGVNYFGIPFIWIRRFEQTCL